jgi:hypothetical protein
LVRQSFGQLAATLRDLRSYPMTMLFLVAYLFYNDGIQTVIASASVYGERELGFETSVLIATILLVQFVAFGGALLFGQIAQRVGSRATIMSGLLIWMMVVSVGYFLPDGQLVPFLTLAVGIGLVLGGTQALSRSLFSAWCLPAGRRSTSACIRRVSAERAGWERAVRARTAVDGLLPPGDPGAHRVLRAGAGAVVATRRRPWHRRRRPAAACCSSAVTNVYSAESHRTGLRWNR